MKNFQNGSKIQGMVCGDTNHGVGFSKIQKVVNRKMDDGAKEINLMKIQSNGSSSMTCRSHYYAFMS